MYKAKCDIYIGHIKFEAGKLYTKKEISGLVIDDFEFVGDEVEETKPKSMTTESLKPKKAKK